MTVLAASLAVGAPGENSSAGAVNVFYGVPFCRAPAKCSSRPALKAATGSGRRSWVRSPAVWAP